MMFRRAINPLAAFPFYDSLDKQQHRDKLSAGEPITGIISPSNRFPSFQFPIKEVGQITWQLIELENSTPFDLPPNAIDLDCFENDYSLLTYNGTGVDLSMICGKFYYLKISLQTGTNQYDNYFSEVFLVDDYFVELTYSNNSDFSGIYYQEGFEQKIYLNGQFDRPEIENDEEVLTDGNGNEHIVFNLQIEKAKFVFLNCMESQLNALNSIRNHSSKSINLPNQNQTFELTDFEFSNEPLGNFYQKGIFKFKIRQTNSDSCGKNLVKVQCPPISVGQDPQTG